MSAPKNRSLAIPSILFCITFAAVITGFFASPADGDTIIDRLFYYITNIVFWGSGAFLLNTFIRRFLWGGIFKTSAGARTIGWIEDFSTSVVYLTAFAIIVSSVLGQGFSASWLFIYLILLTLITLLRQKLLKFFSNAFISSLRPFKPGDWIRLIHKSGQQEIIGEVINFDRIAIQLKSENGTLMLFPNSLLEEYIIENYRGINSQPRFSLPLELSSAIEPVRAKRLIKAGARQAVAGLNNGEFIAPEVLINKMSRDKIEYIVNFHIAPWEKVTPEEARDMVLSHISDHLKFAGIDENNGSTPHGLLDNIPFFELLKKEEKERLFAASKQFRLKEGTSIIKQGENGSSMFILTEGLLDVSIKTDGEESGEIRVGVIAPGEFFGEMSLFTGEDRSATVTAGTDSAVLEIPKEAIKGILECNPGLVNEFGKVIAERQLSNTSKLDEFKSRKDSLLEKIAGKIKAYFELSV